MKHKQAREWILNNCFTKDGNKLNRWKSKEATEFLSAYYGDSSGEKIYRILHKIDYDCKCLCGNQLEFRGFQKGYALFCSRQCSGKFTSDKVSKTKINLFKNDEYKQKVILKQKETKKKIYGDSAYNNRNKAEKTCVKKYGVSNPSYIGSIVDKIISTKRNNSKCDDGYIQTQLSLDTIKCINNKQWMIDAISVFSVYELADILNCSVTTIYRRCEGYNINFDDKSSSFENEVYNYVCSIYKGNVIQNDRKILHGKEIDIYIPEYNLAIECDGVYWHSEQQGKKRNYHLRKTELCEENGIHLLHIFDNEWGDVWKSVIANKFGIYELRIGARQTKIIDINHSDYMKFMNDNHLQGVSFSPISYGLVYNNKIVSVMSFSKSRFSNFEYELQRFCTIKNYQVYGAASKLLNHFKKYYDGSVVSYANRRWSTGDLYEKLGFEFSHNSDPNYFYYKHTGHSSKYKLESRNKYQKHKLGYILDYFDKNISEYQNMLNNGYDRIWDCGNKVYVLDV